MLSFLKFLRAMKFVIRKVVKELKNVFVSLYIKNSLLYIKKHKEDEALAGLPLDGQLVNAIDELLFIVAC